MSNKTIWKYLWERPMLLVVLLVVWMCSLASISWFVKHSGENNPIWIIMFLTVPISIMLLAWLIIKTLHQGDNM